MTVQAYNVRGRHLFPETDNFVSWS